MSLVNEYLQKTQSEAPSAPQGGVVPPTLTSSTRRRRNPYAVKLGAAAAGVVVVAVLAFVFAPEVLKALSPSGTNKEDTGQGVAQEKPAATVEVATASQQTAAPAVAPAPEPAPAPPPANVAPAPAPPKAASIEEETIAPPAAPVRTAQAQAAPDQVTEGDIRQAVEPVPAPAPQAAPRRSASAYIPESDVLLDDSFSTVTVSSRRTDNSGGKTARVRTATNTQKNKPVPMSADQYYQLGVGTQRQGKFTEAAGYFEKGLSASPSDINILNNLAAVYIRLGRYDSAAVLLGRARQVNPGNVNVINNLGMVELKRGNKPAAKRWFQQAIKISPTNETAMTNLAYLAQQDNDVAAMEDYYRMSQAGTTSTDINVLLAYASTLERSSRYSEAVKVYQESLELPVVQRDSALKGQIRNRIRLLAKYAR